LDETPLSCAANTATAKLRRSRSRATSSAASSTGARFLRMRRTCGCLVASVGHDCGLTVGAEPEIRQETGQNYFTFSSSLGWLIYQKQVQGGE